MAISTEVLNTTYRKLSGPLVQNFLRKTPFTNHLMQAGKVKKSLDGGSTIERPLSTGSPATGRGLISGVETLALSRAKRIDIIKVEPHRIGAAIAIPKRELVQNNGQAAVVRLIEAYPEAFMASTELCLESYWLTGAAPALGNHAWGATALSGFSTLYGPFSSGLLTGTTNGLLGFATPASQAGTVVQNLAKSEAKHYYNQYEQASSWSNDGLRSLSVLVRRCNHYGQGSKVSIGFLDPDTMANLEDSQRSRVRISVVEDKVAKTDNDTIHYGGVDFYMSLDMDRTRTAFSGDPMANGGGYVLNPEYFELSVLEEAKLSPFEEQIAQQDVVTSQFRFHAALLCTHLIAQGTISGTAL